MSAFSKTPAVSADVLHTQEAERVKYDDIVKRLEEKAALYVRDREDLTFVDGHISTDTGMTLRLATHDDIPAICDIRTAQSLEYWGVSPASDELSHFRAETEAHLWRNLNKRMFVLLFECDGEIASMSGLEVFDRLPTFGGVSGVQRTATVIACYTNPAYRGRGLMGKMLRAWPLIALQVGVDAIYVETRNASMRHVAEDAGYEHASDRFKILINVAGDED